MKKIFFLSAIVLTALCSSCSKQELPEGKVASGEKQTVIAHVNLSNLGSKLALTDNNPGISSVWEEGDTFKAIQDGTSVVTFTLVSGAGTTEGVFSAEASDVTSTTQWVAVLGNNAVDQTTEIHCGFLGQDGTLEGLRNFGYVKAEGLGSEPAFNFAEAENLSCVLRVKLPAGVKCIEYTPSGWMKVTASSTDKVYFNTGSEDADFSASKTTTITLSSVSTEGSTIYLALPVLNYSRTLDTFAGGEQYGNFRAGVIITLLNDTSDNANLSNGIVWEEDITKLGGRVGTLDLSGTTLISRPTPAEAIEFTKSGDIKCKLHSSALTQVASDVHTYWAPYNIGATKPSEIGNYYQWGMHITKSVYQWASSYDLKHSTKTTYRQDVLSVRYKISGTNSGYSIAGGRYDTARIIWGIAWRMPHMIEVYAASNERITRDIVDGVDGVRFTDGANSIFVPNSRYMDGTTLNNASTPAVVSKKYTNDNYDCARFWSADQLNKSYGNAGYDEAFSFGNSNATETEYDYWRRVTFLGFPVRAVLASSTVVKE